MPEWKQKLAAKMKELEDASALNESGGNAAFAPTATQNANNPRMLPKASLSAAAQTDALQQRTMDMMQYSMSEDERDSVKEQIRKAQSELDKMEPVAQISDSGRKGMRNDRFIDKIIKALSATGYKVENRAVGEITFSEDELRDSLKYIVNDAEAAAYLALPRVLRRGIIINERSNHKDRGYDTITLAAPIVLNGERANMGVLIKKTKGNKYKVHRILTPDGEVFVLPEMADAEPTMPVVSPKLPSLREGRLEPSALRQKHKINASNHSVAEKSGEVKRQFSFGDNAEKIATDSNGKELSEKQQQYFKDSLVRDEDGRLLVVYHGTDAEFTVFDRTKTRANMDIQGNFFSPWEIDAQGYGSKVKAYYLNIKNPAPEGIAYKALNRFKGQNNAGIKARDYLESLGYDGVDNGGGEYIAFYPEQIKDIENLNPTISPDYRWSISENMTEKKEVVQNIKSIMDKGQGKNVVELKRYVDTLNSGASPAKDRVRMLPTAAQTEAEKIIAAAHREGLNVEEYLRRNSELYEVEGRYDAAAREALAMEKRQSGRQFSISDTLDSDLDRVLAGTFPAHRGEVYIGETSYFLKRKLKARALKVTMPVNKAYAAMVSKEKAIKDGRYDETLTYHKLGKEGLIRALMASEEPAAAFAAVPDGKKKRTNSVVLVTDSPGEDGPLIVIEAIDEKARLNNKKIEVNKTVTAYDRKQIEADIIEAAKDGRLLYLDKEKSQTFMNLAGGPGYNSLAVIREADFDNNILNFLNEVKWQKSGRDSYTEGDSEKEYPLAEAYRAALQKKEAGSILLPMMLPPVIIPSRSCLRLCVCCCRQMPQGICAMRKSVLLSGCPRFSLCPSAPIYCRI